MVLDPRLVGKNPWSKTDYNNSTVPRTWWYLDQDNREPQFNNMPMYKTKVDADLIYNLAKDPENLLEKHAVPYSGIPNYNSILRHLSGWRRENDTLYNISGSWLRKHVSDYQGVYYVSSGIEIVSLFDFVSCSLST